MCLAQTAIDLAAQAGIQAAPAAASAPCVNPVTNQVLLQFDKTATGPAIVFEIVVLVVTVAMLWLLRRSTPRVLVRYATLASGVLIFEVFTAPMWLNEHFGQWAYYYQDVSWVLTLGWSTMIFAGMAIVDRVARRWHAAARFVATLALLTPVALTAEGIVVGLGLRKYSPEVLERVGTLVIPGINVYAAAIYYTPVFMALIIAFYLFWQPAIDRVPEPARSTGLAALGRRLVIMAVGIFLFEVMIEPMVNNKNFPAWSYVWHDISLVMTGFWVVLLSTTTLLVDWLLRRATLGVRFAGYLFLIGLVAAPIEGWFIKSGFREYGPSAVANFSGFHTWLGNMPIEVVLGVPLYLALVIGFTRTWERFLAVGQPATETAVVAQRRETAAGAD